MLIEAFRRKAKVTHEIGGIKYLFAPNQEGHIVSSVEDKDHAARFLAITEAFRPYGEPEVLPVVDSDNVGEIDGSVVGFAQALTPHQAPDQASQEATQEAPTKFVISNGERTIDLAALDDKALKDLARELGVDKPVDMRKKGDSLRAEIVAAVKALSEA